MQCDRKGNIAKKNAGHGQPIEFPEERERKKFAKINATLPGDRGTTELCYFLPLTGLSERLDPGRHARDFARDGIAVQDTLGNATLHYRHRLAES